VQPGVETFLLKYAKLSLFESLHALKKCSLVHVAPDCAVSGEESDHFGFYVRSISLYLFIALEPMTSWSQGNKFTAAPGLTTWYD
jgi:hypothetical protein